MVVRPVDFNGMIQSSNEISQIKANQDTKAELQQNLLQNVENAEHMEAMNQVHGDIKTETENLDDEGGGVYENPRKKKRKKKEEKEFDDGRVYKKGKGSSFDIKI